MTDMRARRPTPKAGDKFQHFKGGEYVFIAHVQRTFSWDFDERPAQVVGLVHDAENPNTVLALIKTTAGNYTIVGNRGHVGNEYWWVVYQSVKDGKMWIRTDENFMETIDIEESGEGQKTTVYRFRAIS